MRPPPAFSSETAKAKRSTHAASEDSSTASLRRLSRRSTSEFEARRRYIFGARRYVKRHRAMGSAEVHPWSTGAHNTPDGINIGSDLDARA